MANNKPPGRRITGIRASVPTGYLLGRVSPGEGDVELVTLAKMQAAGLAPTKLPPSGPAGGDLGGTYPAPTVVGLQGEPVSATAPTTGQVLEYNGTEYVPVTPSSGSGGGASSVYDDGSTLEFALTDPSGQLILDPSGNPIFAPVVLPVAAIPPLNYLPPPAFTQGSVWFQGAANVSQDNANFFWDDTNKSLGIGTATPATVTGISGTFGLNIINSTAVGLAMVQGATGGGWYGLCNNNSISTSTQFVLIKTLGVPGTPLANGANNTLGVFSFRGYTGTLPYTGSKGYIGYNTWSAWTTSDNSTWLDIRTTPVGSTTLTRVFGVGPNGGAVIGNSFIVSTLAILLASPANGLIVQGAVGCGTSTPRVALDVAGTIAGSVYTVATLPAASLAANQRAAVSDGLGPTFMALIVGGGTVFTPVYSDGTNWYVG